MPSESICCAPLLKTVLDELQAEELAARLKVLADPVRLRLVSLLACCNDGELCACDLPDLLGRSQPTISHHLKVLAEAGIISREQRGKWAWFRLLPGALDPIRSALGPAETVPTEAAPSSCRAVATGALAVSPEGIAVAG